MKRNRRGFTLIEVLVALAIVSIALAAVMRSVAVATDELGYEIGRAHV